MAEHPPCNARVPAGPGTGFLNEVADYAASSIGARHQRLQC